MTPAPKYDTDKMITEVRAELPEHVNMQEKVDIADAFFGMNSVNIVVAMLKISIDPIPKKKFPIICITN